MCDRVREAIDHRTRYGGNKLRFACRMIQTRNRHIYNTEYLRLSTGKKTWKVKMCFSRRISMKQVHIIFNTDA